MDSNKVNAVHVKVVTEAGVVYLMGIVTEKEANDAVEIARTTGGVIKVVKIFELCKASDAIYARRAAVQARACKSEAGRRSKARSVPPARRSRAGSASLRGRWYSPTAYSTFCIAAMSPTSPARASWARRCSSR